MKKILQAFKAAWSASFTDQYIDRCGAEKIESIPDDAEHLDTPVLIWIGNYCIKNQSKVYLTGEHLIISEKNKNNPIRIALKEIKNRGSDSSKSFSEMQRPFTLQGIRVGFGSTTDNLIHSRKTEPAEQDGAGQRR